MPTSPRGRSSPDIKPFYTVAELGGRWVVSQRHVRRLIESGALKATHFGRLVRISAAEVALYEARSALESIAGA